MRKTWIVAALAMTLTLAACSGGSGTPKTPATAPATATTAPVATSTPAAVPVIPAALDDYGKTIAAYLSASPSAAADCLTELYAAWKMPLPEACELVNMDGDNDAEIVAAVAQKALPGSDTRYKVLVFDGSAGTYRVAYESPAFGLDPAVAPVTPIVAIAELNTGGKDVVYRSDVCTAGACTATVHVVGGTSGGVFAEKEPVEGITVEGVKTITVNDAGQIVFTARQAETPATGPQRGRTETWAWNGTAFAVVNQAPATPTYLYHAILDADALLALGDYAGAEAAFVAAVADKRLDVWRKDSQERPELESYALFRAGLAALLAGGDATAALAHFDQSKAYTTTLHAQLAGSFEAAYAAKANISIACGAARDDVQANLAEYEKFWDFGQANPRFDPATICPF